MVSGHGGRRAAEDRVRRFLVAAANFALAGMLVHAVGRFQSAIVPVYGDRFVYVPIAMLALACWRVIVGLLLLFGRRRGV